MHLENRESVFYGVYSLMVLACTIMQKVSGPVSVPTLYLYEHGSFAVIQIRDVKKLACRIASLAFQQGLLCFPLHKHSSKLVSSGTDLEFVVGKHDGG